MGQCPIVWYFTIPCNWLKNIQLSCLNFYIKQFLFFLFEVLWARKEIVQYENLILLLIFFYLLIENSMVIDLTIV